MQLLRNVSSRLRAVFFKSRVEQAIDEELRAHIALRAEANIAAGLSPEEALRDARVRFGGVEAIKEACRDVRGAGVFDVLAHDLRFAFRMFRKYPGVSIVSVIGMSLAIAVAAGYFAVLGALLSPTLPLSEGDRVVAIQNADVTEEGDNRQTLRDFVAWRDELKSVRELAALAKVRRNLVLPDRAVEPVDVAEITASGLRIARTAPSLGRLLLEEDEREGAAPVVVIAFEEWQRVFGGDAAIIGRQVQLGGELHAVVGVMPEGFRFPVNHRYWIPLRLRLADVQSGEGPDLSIFGRLANGATRADAQSELAVIGSRMATTYPQTHAHLRPRVLPYTYSFIGIDTPGVAMTVRAVQIAVGLLLVLVSANVAILLYARIATRAGEIALRTALGATRKRIISQLFVEAFVLSATAAAIGLTIVRTAFDVIKAYQAQETDDYLRPFWVDYALTPSVIAYVAILAVVAAVIAGVLPALKATRRLQVGLQQLPSRGSKQQLGRTWTALIVIQVAIAVAVLPSAIYIASEGVLRGTARPSYAAEQIVRASLSLQGDDSAPKTEAPDSRADSQLVARAKELVRRLETEPTVSGVTFASYFPGNERLDRVEVEGAMDPAHTSTAAADGAPGTLVRTNRADAKFFSVLGVPVLAGRGFIDAEAREGSATAVVDQLFVDRFLRDGDVLGRRIRLLQRSAKLEEVTPGPWLEIVGVVPDFTVHLGLEPPKPAVYRPLALDGRTTMLRLAVQIRNGSAPAFAARLREIAATVDPALQLDVLEGAADAERHARQALLYVAVAVAAVTASVLLLSATGIYAMMSFTVTTRRREIGIRVALGANARHILTGVFARASAQLGAGVLSGLGLAVVVDRAIGGGPVTTKGTLLLPVVVGVMITIGLLAALRPARRGLAVQPIEVLREE
jgi:predicted permease